MFVHSNQTIPNTFSYCNATRFISGHSSTEVCQISLQRIVIPLVTVPQFSPESNSRSIFSQVRHVKFEISFLVSKVVFISS